MLTRLKVSGFKNLVDVDVRFGPFTCIAGVNGVGKSNLFDAIKFLSALADRTFVDAALSVRDEGARAGDVRSIFHRVGTEYAGEMSFEAEIIVPREGVDDLGQEAKARITFLRYRVKLAYRGDASSRSSPFELINEELVHINLSDAFRHLLFPHKVSWRRSAVQGRRTSPFISTSDKEGHRVIELHQDGGPGRTLSLLATNLPRTVLSTANAAETPTALLARRELQSWRLLQLEPSALRKPDEFTDPPRLGADGSHLAATLYHLARVDGNRTLAGHGSDASSALVYSQIANRLAELIDDVDQVRVERDEKRELLTLQVSDRSGTWYPARALSDGTLRFLALAVLALDPEAKGLVCLEEPENGIHPERIPAMLRLLQDIATDVDEPVGYDNPLRQVIINTHSPLVVAQVPDNSLLMAELREKVVHGKRFNRVCFMALVDTWRQIDANEDTVSRGKLLAYLDPLTITNMDIGDIALPSSSKTTRTPGKNGIRVLDRTDIRQMLLPLG